MCVPVSRIISSSSVREVIGIGNELRLLTAADGADNAVKPRRTALRNIIKQF